MNKSAEHEEANAAASINQNALLEGLTLLSKELKDFKEDVRTDLSEFKNDVNKAMKDLAEFKDTVKMLALRRRKRIADLESACLEIRDTLLTVVKENTEMRDKPVDLESRSRRKGQEKKRRAMLYKAQLMEKDISIMYTAYTGNPTAKDISQAEEASMKQHPVFADFIYTDPRGGHVLPQTTELLSATDVSQHYLMTLGFRRKEEGLILKKIFSGIWPSLPDTGRKGKVSPMQQQYEEVETQRLYEKILPILDLMQATQINSGVYVGSGLIEGLQYGSLLVKLGHHREHNIILHRSQAQLATAPYLPQISMQQENTLLQALLTDIMDELGGRRSSTERVWNEMHKVGWLKDLIHSVEKEYLHKKAQRNRYRQMSRDKAKLRKRSRISRELFPTPATEHKVTKSITPSAENWFLCPGTRTPGVANERKVVPS
ncbi:spermatogenesis-associated protein 16-like [Dicentrarchus labrax]|uniref:spermatogenesis-associated protein 16-like n=1 Tax=Dicentrarchus labrax TaxID=13489 RepID=UPI0021F5015C|nr:spermatogenesis-associated protein 16-like [Dicentrarchus labrax]